MKRPAFPVLLAASLLAPALLAQNPEKEEKQLPLEGIQGREAPLLEVDTWIQLPPGKERVEITDYPDKIVVMLFFQYKCRASQEREMPVLKNLVEHYEGQDGIVFLAIQTTFQEFLDNSADKLQVVADNFGLSIPFGHSPKLPPKLAGTESVSMKYLPAGTPWWVIIDRSGKVEYNGHILNEEEAVKGFDRMLAGLPPR